MQDLETDLHVFIYINRINFSKKYNIYGKCTLCSKDGKLLLQIDCGHTMCIDCYSDVNEWIYNGYCKNDINCLNVCRNIKKFGKSCY